MKHLGMIGPDDQEDARGAVRVFLSAYLIMAHPMQALSHGGSQPQEQELMTKASALLQPFEVHMQNLGAGKIVEQSTHQTTMTTYSSPTTTLSRHLMLGKDRTRVS